MSRKLGLLLAIAATGCATAPQDDCADVNCGTGTCVIGTTGPDCLCPAGLGFDGSACVAPTTLCDPNPCVGDGGRNICAVVGDTYACLCSPGLLDLPEGCVAPPSPPSCDPNPCAELHRGQCAIDAGTVLCGCDPGFFERGSGSCEYDDCANRHGGDNAEPNDCASMATTVGVLPSATFDGGLPAIDAGPSGPLSFSPAGDVDWFKFSVEENHNYDVEVLAGGWPATDLQLFEADARTPVPGTTILAGETRRTFHVVSAGQILVRTTQLQESAYELRVLDRGIEDHGDSLADATLVTLPVSLMASFDYSADIDVFKMNLDAEHLYLLQPAGAEVLDGQGAILRDSLSSGGRDFYCRDGGTYFVRVSGQPGATGPVPYLFEVLDQGHDEPGQTPETAPVMALPMSWSGTVLPPGDTDYMQFDALKGHAYLATCTSDAGLYCTVGIGGTAAYSQWGSDPFDYGTVASSTGRYFVAAGGQATTAAPYSVTVSDMGLDLPGLESPTIVTADGGSIASRIDTRSDVDAFAFSEESRHSYELTCARGAPAPNAKCNVTITDQFGNSFPVGVSGSTSFFWAAPAIPRTVRVAFSTTDVMSPYTWSLSDHGPEAGGDDPASAPVITLGSPASGRIESFYDRDYFGVQLIAGTTYVVQVSSISNASAAVLDRHGIRLTNGYISLAFTAPSTETYVIEVTGDMGATYTLLVQEQ